MGIKVCGIIFPTFPYFKLGNAIWQHLGTKAKPDAGDGEIAARPKDCPSEWVTKDRFVDLYTQVMMAPAAGAVEALNAYSQANKDNDDHLSRDELSEIQSTNPQCMAALLQTANWDIDQLESPEWFQLASDTDGDDELRLGDSEEEEGGRRRRRRRRRERTSYVSTRTPTMKGKFISICTKFYRPNPPTAGNVLQSAMNATRIFKEYDQSNDGIPGHRRGSGCRSKGTGIILW
jgi:hypothetical protein